MTLLGANRTGHDPLLHIGRAGQGSTLGVGVQDHVLVVGGLSAVRVMSAGRVHADELGGAGVVVVVGHDVPRVLQGPALRAGVGAGDHDGGGTRDAADGTGRGRVALSLRARVVFRAVNVGVCVERRLVVAVENGVRRQAEMIGGSAQSGVDSTSDDSCCVSEGGS